MAEADERPESDETEASADVDAGEEGEYEEAEEPSLPWQWMAWGALGLAVIAALYFGVGFMGRQRDVKEARRLMAEGKNAEAAQLLGTTLSRSPNSDQVLLLKIKAEFLAGNWPAAAALMQRYSGQSIKGGDLGAEVGAIAQRAQAALRLHDEAKQLFGRGEAAKAEVVLTEAAGLYPEAPEIRESLLTVQGSTAFQKKEYARFLEIAEEAVKRRPGSPMATALLASALSAQYAATGEASYRERAEQTLDQARKLSESSEPARVAYEEYSERIRHRLQTREIIDRAEYDRRFRMPAAAQKEKEKEKTR